MDKIASPSPEAGGKRMCSAKTPDASNFDDDDARRRRRSSGPAKKLLEAPQEDPEDVDDGIHNQS